MSLKSPEIANALALHQKKQWAGAEKAYRKVLKEEAYNTQALINLGFMYSQMGVIEKSRQCYMKALKYEPSSIEANFNYGNLCFSLKDYRQAISYYLVLVERENPHAQALYQLAKCHQEMEDWLLCRSYLEEFLVLSANNPNALLDLGVRELALKVYQEMASAAPTAWKEQYSLMRWHDTYGEKKEFEYFYSLAKKYCKAPGLVDYSLAQSRFDLGRYEEAASAYKLALETGPDLYSSQIGLAACYMHLKKPEQAKLLFGTISKSNDVSVLSELARTILEYKFFAEALKVFEKIVKLRPDLPDTHLNLAKAYYQNWNISLARKSLNKALEIRPGYEEAEDLLLDLYAREGQNDECLSICKQRLERDGL